MKAAERALALRPKNRKKLEEEKQIAEAGIKVASKSSLQQRRGGAFLPGMLPGLPPGGLAG